MGVTQAELLSGAGPGITDEATQGLLNAVCSPIDTEK